jgi:hypothetical protein
MLWLRPQAAEMPGWLSGPTPRAVNGAPSHWEKCPPRRCAASPRVEALERVAAADPQSVRVGIDQKQHRGTALVWRALIAREPESAQDSILQS